MPEKNHGVYAKMKELGIELPTLIPKDTPTVTKIKPLTGDILLVSGTGNFYPFADDGKSIKGKAGEVPDEVAIDAARDSARYILAALDFYLGDLNRITEIVKLLVLVACKPDFYKQSMVANGCSETFIKIFGEEKGKATRSAMGVACLPNNFIVETEAMVRFK